MPNEYISHLKIWYYRKFKDRIEWNSFASTFKSIKVTFIIILPFNLVHLCNLFLFHIEIEGKVGELLGGGYVAPPSQIIGGLPPPLSLSLSLSSYAYDTQSKQENSYQEPKQSLNGKGEKKKKDTQSTKDTVVGNHVIFHTSIVTDLRIRIFFIIYKVFPCTNCPYHGGKVTYFGKSVKVLTGEFSIFTIKSVQNIMSLVNWTWN